MNRTGQDRLSVILTFTPDGSLELVFFLAGSDQEEAILRTAVAPALKAIERKTTFKGMLLWAFNHGLLTHSFTQRIYDFFRLRSA